MLYSAEIVFIGDSLFVESPLIEGLDGNFAYDTTLELSLGCKL